MLFVLEIRSGATEYRDHLTPVGLNAEQLPAPPPHLLPPADEATPLVLGRPEDPYFRDVLPLLGVRKRFFLGRVHGFEGRVSVTCCPGVDWGWQSRKPSFVRRGGGWSSIWDGSRLSPLAAYPRFQRSGLDLTAYLALLRLGVTLPRLLPTARWALTPPFHPYPKIGRFVFCGPVRRLSTPRRYLAICPMELGLSSTRP